MSSDGPSVILNIGAPTFDDLWTPIEPDLAGEIHPYIHQYGFGIINQSIVRLENAQLEQDRQVWARDWAFKLSDNDAQAWQYNMDRKLCLAFLYRLIDNGLVLAFKAFRIDRIVRLCLVMDRANALYNMVDRKTNTRGLYWFAEADRFWMESLLSNQSEIDHLRTSKAPLNRRLRALLDIEELGYKNDMEIRGWMKPQKPDQEDWKVVM